MVLYYNMLAINKIIRPVNLALLNMKKKNKPTKKVKVLKRKSENKPKVQAFGRIIPLGDRVVLKPLSMEEQTTTLSGIIIPDTVSKEKPEQGKVVAVGEGRWEGGKRVPVSLKIGDRVVFSRYGYDEVKLDGEEYYILKEENILAVIN